MNPKTSPQRLRTFKVRLTAIAILLFLGLMIISNPSEKSFRRYLKEYISTQSGSTILPERPQIGTDFTRVNYYLFSSYDVKMGENTITYLGIFGMFKRY